MRLGHAVGHGHGAPVDALEHLGELRLEVQPVVEHQVGLREVDDVALARLVDVRVDARPHEARNLDAPTADALGRLRDHPGRGDDPDRAVALEALQRPVVRRDTRAAHGEHGERGDDEQADGAPHGRTSPTSSSAATSRPTA